MKEELVSYKTVKLAQKKGIDFRSKEFNSAANKANKARIYHSYVTQALLQKYLREVYKIDVLPAIYKNEYYNWVTVESRTHKLTDKKLFSTYEKALEVGLQGALDLI